METVMFWWQHVAAFQDVQRENQRSARALRLAYVDIKRGAINRSYVFPIPEYHFDVQQARSRAQSLFCLAHVFARKF